MVKVGGKYVKAPEDWGENGQVMLIIYYVLLLMGEYHVSRLINAMMRRTDVEPCRVTWLHEGRELHEAYVMRVRQTADAHFSPLVLVQRDESQSAKIGVAFDALPC